METVYCSACGKVMSSAAHACPECGHPNSGGPAPVSAVGFVPRGLLGPVLTVASPIMPFGEAIKSFFKNYAVFSGRARRSEYWFAALFTWLISIPVSLLDAIISPNAEIGLFTTLWSLAILIPSLAIISRRLHDADTSFGYFFLVFIPLVGLILLIIKLVEEGTPGTNRFGPSPKYS